MPPLDVPDDLAERIDRSFGPGPDAVLAVDELLSRGRAARRRRRTAAAGLAVNALVVVATGSSLVLSGGSDHARGTDGYVSSPSSTTPVAPTGAPTTAGTTSGAISEGEREHLKALAARAVTFGGAGGITLAPGASVVRSLANPYGATAPAWSRGLAVDFRGHEFWYAMSGPGDGSVGGSTQYVVSQADQAAFEQYVAEQAVGGATTSFVGPDVWPDVTSTEPAHLTTGGDLVAEPGYQVVSQRIGVDVGLAWAGPGDDTAAAMVRADDGSAYFVLARRLGDKPAQYVTVPQAGNGADLAGFLEIATERYATAAGGR